MSVKEESMSDADDAVYSERTIKREPMFTECSYSIIKVEKEDDTDAVSSHNGFVYIKQEELEEQITVLKAEQESSDTNVTVKDEIEIGPTVIQPQYIGSSLHTTDASKAELIQCGGADVALDTTTPDIIEKANGSSYLLPEQSRRTYEKTYQKFMNWRMNRNTCSLSEKVLLVYFQELSTKHQSSTLWAEYSMLKSTIGVYHQTDISKYMTLQVFLKNISVGHKAKQSKIFTPKEIKTFLKEAPDKQYLAMKTILIFGIMGACRRQELYALKWTDVTNVKTEILVNILDKNSKIDRAFTVKGEYYDICKQYMELRPNPCKNPSFFLKYANGKCFLQRIGVHNFGSMGKAIATYLKLPNPGLFTGNCFRRTSASLAIDACGNITTVKKHCWKSTSVPNNTPLSQLWISTRNDSVQNKIQVSNTIMNSIEVKNEIEIHVNDPLLTSKV